MAEIKDVYSLEFNSSQFQSEIDSAIARIEELNGAMADGADVADELSMAQNNLVDVLGTEAKGVEQLNQKRNVLVNTQNKLNKETKASVAVSNQLNNTNKQLATTTGQAAAQQRGLGQTLLQGTRSIGQMRRVASTLTFAFRAISAAIPFGLILSFAGPVIEFFTNLYQGADKSAKSMEKLNDATLTLGERVEIAKEGLDELNAIEYNRGKLTDEEEKRRRELVKVYEDTSLQIVEEEIKRYQTIASLQTQADRIRVKLMGDTTAAVLENFKVESKAIVDENEKREKILNKQMEMALEARNAAMLNNDQVTVQKQLDIYFEAEKERSSIWALQTQQIIQLETERDKKLAELEQKRKDKLKQDILDEIKNTEDLYKFRVNATEENTAERYQAELNLINVLEDLRKKYANQLGISQLELLLLEQENTKKREEVHENYYDNLEKLRQKDLDDIEKMQKAYEDDLHHLKNTLDSASEYRVDIAESDLSMQLLNLEKERNQQLLFAFGNIDAQEKINEAYNLKRKMLEDKTNKEIIRIRIDFLKKIRDASASDPAALAALNKQINDLELKFEELNTAILENTTNAFKGVKDEGEKTVKGLTDKQKELLDNTANLVQGASDNVFNVLNAQVQSYISNLDLAIDKSKSALDEIRANSENYNAQQLEIEKQRLERLEAERARAVEREKTIGMIQVGINSAIAISKAAAEGGPAAPFTIALTLASLIAGLAQARVAAGNAFFHGIEYLERGNNKAGRDTIPAMLNEGERVITTDTNNRYWDVLSAVHNNRIPADVLNSFANAYQSGGLRAALGAFGENISLSSELGNKSVFVNVAQTYSGMENRLERIEAVLTDLPKYMPRTVVSANANGIFKIVEQKQRRKNYSSNWSK